MRILIVYVVTLILSQGLLSLADNNSNEECKFLLSSQKNRLKPRPGQAEEILSHFYRELGIAEPGSIKQGLLEWLGIKPEAYSEVVILSLNNFWGDNYIFHFSTIDYFLNKYPEMPVTLVSPKASALARTEIKHFQALTFPVRFAEYKKRTDRDHHINLINKRLPEFIEANIKPGALVLYDLTTLDKADWEIGKVSGKPELKPSLKFHQALSEIGATAIGLSNLENERIMLGITGIEVIAPKANFEKMSQLKSSVDPIRDKAGHSIGVRINSRLTFSEPTIYGSWLENLITIFGPEVYMSWDNRLYTHAEDEALVTTFFNSNKMNPRKPYFLFNLNTFGGDKVRHLKPAYAEIFRRVVISAMDLFPDDNILATFPENQFGPEVQVTVMDFAAQHRGRVALIPASYRDLLPAFISNARQFAGYDSGPIHLSAFLPPGKVLSFSVWSGGFFGGPALWRKPQQRFVATEENEPPELLAERIIQWMIQSQHNTSATGMTIEPHTAESYE